MHDLKNNLETCALALLKDRNLEKGACVYDSELSEVHFTHKRQNRELTRKKKTRSTFQVHDALEGVDGKLNESSGCSVGLGKAWRCPSAGLRVRGDPRRNDLLGPLHPWLNASVES